MALDAQQVRNIAELAKLTIADNDLPEYQENLDKILTMFEQLTNVDTSQVEPMTNPLDATQRLRADKASETNQREKFQSMAPQTEQGYYLVPRVIE